MLSLTLTILLATGAAPPANAKTSSEPVLLSFDALQKRLGDPKLRLLDCRPKADYDLGHIPGAVWIDAKSIEKQAAVPGALNDPNPWELIILKLGIGPGVEVFVYDANRQLDAARVWWLMRYCGVERVGLIDGGYPLWVRENRIIAKETPDVPLRPFAVHFQHQRLAGREDVLKLLGDKSAGILDARSDAEHSGEAKKSKRAGRLPESCHVEWKNLVDADGRFLSKEKLKKKFEESGLQANEAVVTHCQGGGRSSVNAFALEHVGFDARNYYLGWSDWGNAEGLPVESGPKSKKKSSLNSRRP